MIQITKIYILNFLELNQPTSLCRRALMFVCGIKNNENVEVEDDANYNLNSLEQTSKEKLLLNLFLFIILSTGGGLYLFWSLG